MAEVSHVLSLLRQETSITEEVLGALNRCQSGTKLDANARAAIKKALVLLRGKEAKLVKASEALNVHQNLHAEVESLRREVKSKQGQVQDCARRLTEADAVLRGPLADAKRLLEAGRRAEEAEIHVGDIVDYAQRISGITSAPSYWKPGMAMVGFAPPAPRPEMMRAGALSAFASNTGTSLSASELLRIAHDLDRPPDSTAAGGAGGGGAGTEDAGASGSSGSNSADSSNSSPAGEFRNRNETNRPGDRAGGSGGAAVKREAGGGEGESGDGGIPAASGKGKGKSSKTGAPAGASYARTTPPKRPKISLDLDDLDSDDDDDSSGDDG